MKNSYCALDIQEFDCRERSIFAMGLSKKKPIFAIRPATGKDRQDFCFNLVCSSGFLIRSVQYSGWHLESFFLDVVMR